MKYILLFRSYRPFVRICRTSSQIRRAYVATADSPSRCWLSTGSRNSSGNTEIDNASTALPKMNTGGGDSATRSADAPVEAFLKAPFQKVSQPGLFPWRHETDPPPRLIPGTPDYKEKGFLLGGNIVSSSPSMDALATEYIFLRVPWYNLLFFRRAWEADLVESMQWAFYQAVPAILSNTFAIPFEDVSQSNNVQFSYHQSNQNSPEGRKKEKSGVLSQNMVESMVHPDLLKLYYATREFGTESLRVRLEIKPTDESAQLVNLFAFPFLSRSNNERRKKMYHQLLDSIAESGGYVTAGLSKDAMQTIHQFMDEFQSTGIMESTVICQVLIHCHEIFCVKDVETGRLLQGHVDEKFRRVVHLVRFEQTVTAHWTGRGGMVPFRLEPGEWQITDVDDLLGGNVLL
jgi:hypothetical protein